MGRANQVDPYGKAHTIPQHRGATFTGNWDFGDSRIICDIDRKWRKEGRTYLRLFFLDEATALAAGFRPCHTCRRAELNSYLEGWNSSLSEPDRTKQVNKMLKVQHGTLVESSAAELPDGSMIDVAGSPFLVRGGCIYPWSFDGYGERRPLPEEPVGLITPERTVEVLQHGYDVNIHSSAN